MPLGPRSLPFTPTLTPVSFRTLNSVCLSKNSLYWSQPDKTEVFWMHVLFTRQSNMQQKPNNKDESEDCAVPKCKKKYSLCIAFWSQR